MADVMALLIGVLVNWGRQGALIGAREGQINLAAGLRSKNENALVTLADYCLSGSIQSNSDSRQSNST
jgi:hypothetical protein